MMRTYELEVVAKWEGTHGFGQIVLRPPAINDLPLDPRRPYWCERTPHNGAPLTMDLTPEEMAEVEVGTLFEVRIYNGVHQ